MKKLAIMLGMIVLLAGCTGKPTGQFTAYRGQSAEQILNSAEFALAKGRDGAAVSALQALDALYPFGRAAKQGQLDIIYAYYQNGNNAESLAAADRFIRLYPLNRDTSYAYYMKGLVSFHLGFTWLQQLAGSDPAPRDMTDKKQAFMAFAELVQRYPNSPYVHDAARRMVYIRNLLAKQNVLTAEYYMSRHAYIAAANRAATVVRHYEGTPQVIPALAIMVKAYRKLGLNKMADKTIRIFAASYPNSPEFKKLMA